MRCPYCKTDLPENSKFCDNCGQEISIQSNSSLDSKRYWDDYQSKTSKDDKEYQELIKKENDKLKATRTKILIGISLLIVASVFALIMLVVIPSMDYKKAITMFEQGDYQGAYQLFSKHENYKNSADYLSQFDYYVVSETRKSPSGDVTINEYEYDESHRLSQKGEISYKYKDGNLYKEIGSNYVITYTYSTYNGTYLLMKEHMEYDNSDTFSTTTYSYEKGILTESDYYKENYVGGTCLKTKTKEKYYYNSNGLLQKVVDEEGERETVYSYNSRGQVTSIITTIDGSDRNGEKEYFYYDVVGNLTKREYHNNIRGTVDKYIYTYEYNIWGLQEDQDISGESAKQVEVVASDPSEAVTVAFEETVDTTSPFKQDYWVIFTESYRDDRIEAASVDSSCSYDELFIIWDGALYLNESAGATDCTQYYLDSSGNWCEMGNWTRFSDGASHILASNLDVYDSDGNLLIEGCAYSDIDWSIVDKYR